MTLRASKLFSDSSCTLIAVEAIEFQHDQSNNSCRLYGTIAPVAVIVCNPNGIYAIDMEAKPTAFDKLRQAIPELEGMIADYERAHSDQG